MPGGDGAPVSSGDPVGDATDTDSGKGETDPVTGDDQMVEDDGDVPPVDSGTGPTEGDTGDEIPAGVGTDDADKPAPVTGEDDGTPGPTGDEGDGGDGTDSDIGTNPESEEDGETDEATEDDAIEEENLPLQSSSLPGVGPLALDPTLYGVLQPQFDTTTGTLTIGILFNAGFEATLDGREDSFQIGYDSNVLTLVAPGSPLQLSEVPGTAVTVDPTAGVITVIFNDYVSVTEGQVVGSVTFSGSVSFTECVQSPEPYPSFAYIEFTLPTAPYQAEIEVEGPDCPATEGPFIGMVQYDHQGGMLFILIINSSSPAAGQQVTLTYPTDKLVMDPGSFDVHGFSVEHQREYVIGTAPASDGLITISMIDIGIEGEFVPLQIAIPIGWLVSASCDDTTEVFYTEIGELEFVTDDDRVFDESVHAPGILCNAAPSSKTGIWTTDGDGNPAIERTFDTGDVLVFVPKSSAHARLGSEGVAHGRRCKNSRDRNIPGRQCRRGHRWYLA